MTTENSNNMSEDVHQPSYKLDFMTFGFLLILTALTIWASYATGGTTVLEVSIAMTIATIKASLVVINFMHLRFDNIVYKIFVGVVIVLFLSFMLMMAVDYAYR